jgi:translation initiation factor 6 (eIF-6)
MVSGEFAALMQRVSGSEFVGDFLVGAAAGLVVAHFIVDADAWRLSNIEIRGYMLARLPFKL